jgi:hypothetical protein
MNLLVEQPSEAFSLFRIEREVFDSGVCGVLKVDIDPGQESLFLSTNAVLLLASNLFYNRRSDQSKILRQDLDLENQKSINHPQTKCAGGKC